MKKEWIKYAGERWRGFKTQLTDQYIKKPKKDLPPAHIKYSYIKDETWKEFLKTRDTPEFKVSRSYIFFVHNIIIMFSD